MKSFQWRFLYALLLTLAAEIPVSMMAATTKIPDGARLQIARLRLAEVQGKFPRGTSEQVELRVSSENDVDLTALVSPVSGPSSSSRVREISWRVAEPAVKYDPDDAAKKLFSQPLKWLARNVQIFVPIAFFTGRVLVDIISKKEEENRVRRAEEILGIISSQSPALIKAGQALSSRSDLLPKEYLDQLQKLQDQCPPYPTDQALAVFERETGRSFEDVFEFDRDNFRPVAAASIGQVYKARLRSNGQDVAVKIQRPNCEDAIAVDLYILRWYFSLFQGALKVLKRDIDLVNVIDDFGDLIYREIDYRAEAVNAQRFAELYSSIPDVFVPKVYADISTSKVLTMEWVDGAKLNDERSLRELGLDSSKLVDILVQCSLRQMLENGFFHADPHAGNLIAMPSGKLCYLDFGMVSYVESGQRYSIIEAVVHLVNRDFNALAELYKRMGFIPSDVDTKPIVIALEDALPNVLSAPVGELNFKNVISKLGDVMYKFPFSLPPFYIAIIRCLGVLEGVAIQADKNFRIINDAYPYIASRLLTDQSDELQQALRQLIFKNNQLRWERLQELLEKASATSDYDSSLAIEQLISYLSSPQGYSVREAFVNQSVEIIDEIGVEAVTYILDVGSKISPTKVLSDSADRLRKSKSLPNAVESLIDVVVNAATERLSPSERLVNAGNALQLFRSTGQITPEGLAKLSQRMIKEPTMLNAISRITSALAERAASRFVSVFLNQTLRSS